RATNRTPPAESLIDLGCQCSLLPKRTLGLNLRIRDVAHCNPARGLVPHLTGDEPKYGISHFRHITQPLKVIMIIRGIEAKEITRNDGWIEGSCRNPDDLWRPAIVFRELPGIRLEKRLGRGEVFRFRRDTRIVSIVKGLALELRGAIEAHNRADDHIANLKFLSDSTCSARSNHQFRLHLTNDLLPHINIRKLWAIL